MLEADPQSQALTVSIDQHRRHPRLRAAARAGPVVGYIEDEDTGSSALRSRSLPSLTTTSAFAQGTDIGISGVGLVSVQPIDDAYVGGPVSQRRDRRLRPWIRRRLQRHRAKRFRRRGGVVDGAIRAGTVRPPRRRRLSERDRPAHDSAARLAAQRARRLCEASGTTRVVILGGLAQLDEPTIDGEPREPFDDGAKRGFRCRSPAASTCCDR